MRSASSTGDLLSVGLVTAFVARTFSNAGESSRRNCTYIARATSNMLAMNGMRQPQRRKAHREVLALTSKKAREARITPTGAPAWAKLPYKPRLFGGAH